MQRVNTLLFTTRFFIFLSLYQVTQTASRYGGVRLAGNGRMCHVFDGRRRTRHYGTHVLISNGDQQSYTLILPVNAEYKLLARYI